MKTLEIIRIWLILRASHEDVVVAGGIESQQKRSLLVKWYQAVRLAEEV